MSQELGGNRGRSTAGMTIKAADNLRTNVDERIKFKRDEYKERLMSSEDDFNLSVPAGTIPSGYTGLWVLDDDKGGLKRSLPNGGAM